MGWAVPLGLIAYCFIILVPAATIEAASGGFVWVEEWRHETAGPLEDIAVGDVTGDGRLNLVAVSDSTVNVYQVDVNGPSFVSRLNGLSERPTVVALYDFDGDGVHEIWVGTASPGVVYVFGYDAGADGFRQIARVRWVWGDVKRIVPFNLDDWGLADLAVLTDRGDLTLFRWTMDGFVRVPVGSLGGDVRHVEAADIFKRGKDDLIVARGDEEIAVLSWEREDGLSNTDVSEAAIPREGEPPSSHDLERGRLVRSWENFIWGNHAALFVADFNGSQRAQVVVFSSRRMAHVFGAEGNDLRSVTTPLPWPEDVGRVIGTWDLNRDGLQEIIHVRGSVLQGWTVLPQPAPVIEIALSTLPVTHVATAPYERWLITAGPWGFAYYQAADPGFLRVLRRGTAVELIHPPKIDIHPGGDRIYLSAEDWERLLKVTIRHDETTSRIHGMRGFRFFFGRVGDETWVYDGRVHAGDHRPFLLDNVLYLGVDITRVLGVDMVWDSTARTLVIDP